MAYVSLHALGRRCQKAFSLDDRAIYDDLFELVGAYESLAVANQPPGITFAVPIADGARWVGAITNATMAGNRTARILNVRTYLNTGETEL